MKIIQEHMPADQADRAIAEHGFIVRAVQDSPHSKMTWDQACAMAERMRVAGAKAVVIYGARGIVS